MATRWSGGGLQSYNPLELFKKKKDKDSGKSKNKNLNITRGKGGGRMIEGGDASAFYGTPKKEEEKELLSGSVSSAEDFITDALMMFSGGGIVTAGGKGTLKGIAKLPLNKIGQLPINQKTISLSKSFLSKTFSKKAMKFAGAWAASVFLGRWGHAEAPEALTIPIRDAMWQAKETGNWTLVDEYTEAAEELADTSKWKEIMLWSPISAVVGIADKISGVAQGIQLLKNIAIKGKEIQAEEEAAGETKFMEERRLSDEAARERVLGYREEDTEHYEDIHEQNLQREEEKRERELEYQEEDTEHYADIDARNLQRDKDERAEEVRQREEDTKHYEDIEIKKTQNKVDEARLWNDYWTAIRNKDWTGSELILNQIGELDSEAKELEAPATPTTPQSSQEMLSQEAKPTARATPTPVVKDKFHPDYEKHGGIFSKEGKNYKVFRKTGISLNDPISKGHKHGLSDEYFRNKQRKAHKKKSGET